MQGELLQVSGWARVLLCQIAYEKKAANCAMLHATSEKKLHAERADVICRLSFLRNASCHNWKEAARRKSWCGLRAFLSCAEELPVSLTGFLYKSERLRFRLKALGFKLWTKCFTQYSFRQNFALIKSTWSNKRRTQRQGMLHARLRNPRGPAVQIVDTEATALTHQKRT